MNARPYFGAFGMTLSVVMYYPLVSKILRTRSTQDFSKLFQAGLVMLQLSNLILSVLEQTPYLTAFYLLQLMFCVGVLWLIYKYDGR